MAVLASSEKGKQALLDALDSLFESVRRSVLEDHMIRVDITGEVRPSVDEHGFCCYEPTGECTLTITYWRVDNGSCPTCHGKGYVESADLPSVCPKCAGKRG